MSCIRHPRAAGSQGLCAACLLEQALPLSGMSALTIQVPLGSTDSASVFLVRAETSDRRLMRLKRWHGPAPRQFLAGFEPLTAQLTDWNHEDVPLPVSAGVDAAGRAWVLSEFRQGVPILDGVKTRRLHAEAAAAVLSRLLATVRTAHTRGLMHGSIVPGNVIVDQQSGAAYLLDFGLAALFAGAMDVPALVRSDLAGFAALERALACGQPAAPEV